MISRFVTDHVLYSPMKDSLIFKYCLGNGDCDV
jgi:hypothetical protein